ncbi:MAG TPA: stage III sporulation protein AG, partial [Patescibacteria group bacterium]|nr:stage III sporulation protein AG [Patescibacteria group bacterium]
RTINEKNTSDQVVFMNDQGGTSKPLVLKEVNPDIKGVIIVAEGAKDPKVKLQLTEAVQTVLDVPAYRVSVFESNK